MTMKGALLAHTAFSLMSEKNLPKFPVNIQFHVCVSVLALLLEGARLVTGRR